MLARRRSASLAVLVIAALVLVASPGYAAGHAQYYVLDGFGGIHAGGGAPAISPGTPYFGFDIAKDIVYVPLGSAAGAGDGVLVLDGFGGVHEGGALAAAPVTPATPYFGFDVARAITYRNVPPRVAVAPLTTSGEIIDPDATIYTIRSVTIFAPDDGFLVVQGTVNLSCPGSVGDVVGRTGLNVDSTSWDVSFANYYSTFRDCDDTALGFPPRDIVTLHKTYAVSAGSHTVRLMVNFNARSAGGKLHWDSPLLTATFIDQDFEGTSAPAVVPTAVDPAAEHVGSGS